MMTLTLKIPPETNARLEAEARRRHVSKSRVVRDALERSLVRRTASSPSVYDRIKHICGTVHGPKDLSTDPKYMEGFGA